MKITQTALDGVMMIEPKVFGDSRGYFFESYNRDKFRDAGIDINFIQDNESMSGRGVLRGLHYQLAPYTQAKLVRVIDGRVLDVVVDIRRGSPTFGRSIAVEISAENKIQILIPRGFAHGFVVLSDTAIFAYKCDNTYMPSHERGIAFDDPDLAIDWRVPRAEMMLSAKDKINPQLKDAELFDFRQREYL